jgi:tetratricopeptide (TPR) repeat protein
MWSETYDRELVNIFAIQDEITEAIVSELRVKLDVETQIASATTSNTEAYQEYLQGRYYWNLRATRNIELAIEHFVRATQLDPLYADAWMGLGESWVLLPIWEFSYEKAPEQLKQAKLAAERALALNPTSGRAYAVLGYMHMLKLEWRESFENFELALSFEPENAYILHWYAFALMSVGDYPMTETVYKKALKLDPLSRIINTNAAEQFNLKGQYDIALERIDKTLALAPDLAFAWHTKGVSHIAKGEFDSARAAFQKEFELGSQQPLKLEVLDFIEESVLTGKPGQPPVGLDDPFMIDPYIAPFVLVCAGLYEPALDLIEQQSATNIPHSAVLYLNSVLFQEKMGHMPRYQELVKRLTTIEFADGVQK